MAKGDGGVFRGVTALIEDVRPPQVAQISLLIVGDGYTKTNGALDPQFQTDCNTIKAAINSQLGFSNRKLNVYVRRVWSTQAGADIAAPCPEPAATAATYFDARYGGGLCRLLYGSDDRVLAVQRGAAKTLKNLGNIVTFARTIVLVNSQKLGAASGTDVMWVANGDPQFANIVLHEIGHMVGLADEYEYYEGCGDTNYTGAGYRIEPNVSNTNAETWEGRRSPGDPPVTPAMDCVNCDTRPSGTLPAGIGAFEGAGWYRCGFWRPTRTCKMRDVAEPFCVVCLDTLKVWIA